MEPTLGGKDHLKYGALGLSVEESRTFTTHNAAGEGEKERGRESEVSHFLLLCSPSASLLQVEEQWVQVDECLYLQRP